MKRGGGGTLGLLCHTGSLVAAAFSLIRSISTPLRWTPRALVCRMALESFSNSTNASHSPLPQPPDSYLIVNTHVESTCKYGLSSAQLNQSCDTQWSPLLQENHYVLVSCSILLLGNGRGSRVTRQISSESDSEAQLRFPSIFSSWRGPEQLRSPIAPGVKFSLMHPSASASRTRPLSVSRSSSQLLIATNEQILSCVP
jgi:hypothetical protein